LHRTALRASLLLLAPSSMMITVAIAVTC
jgi:hypothetical protein